MGNRGVPAQGAVLQSGAPISLHSIETAEVPRTFDAGEKGFVTTISEWRSAALLERGLVGVAAAVIGLGVVLSAPVTAWADNEVEADPATPSAGTVAADGIRTAAVQGQIRAEGDQGEIRPSKKAVPEVEAHAFGDIGDNDYLCRGLGRHLQLSCSSGIVSGRPSRCSQIPHGKSEGAGDGEASSLNLN